MHVTVTEKQLQARQDYLNSLTAGRKMFRISELQRMKPSFQRTLNKTHVNEIVRDWQVHRFDDPVVCVCSDGTHLLDDGQHRVEAAALKLGVDAELLCRVVHTDLPGSEFVALNSARRGVTAYWKHAALLSDGDTTALAIDTLLRKHGFSINHGSGPFYVNAVNTVYNLHERDSASLDRAFSILAEIIKKRDGETGWVKANVIQAVWYVVKNYECTNAQMVRGLAKITPERAAPHNQNDPARNAGDIIVAYNKQLPEHRRISVMKPKSN